MLNKHISEIHKVQRNLLFFAKQTQDDKLTSLINKNAEKYISIFKEAFDPEKEVSQGMEYYADVRSLAKYNENLVNGWLVEDFYIYIFNLPIFKEHGFTVSISNHDSDRVIKKKRDYIDSNPDFIINYSDISFGLEIQSLLLPLNYFHIKENKANKAIKNTSFIYELLLDKKETVYIFPYSIKSGTFEKNKNWGGKKSYKFLYNDIPKKRIIKKDNFVNDFLFSFYLFAYYKKFGEKEFFEFGKSCVKLNRTEIIQRVYNSLNS